MSDRRQAIIITTGMDNLPLLAALKENEGLTGASLTRVKALYAKFNAEKAAMDAAENDASLARLKANEEAKAAMTKAFFEEQAAQYSIAAGSIPENMGGGAGLAGAAALGASSNRAAVEVEKLATHTRGTSVAMREGAVMIREGLRRNFSRMIGSFSIAAAAVGAFSTMLLAAIGTAIVAGPSAYFTYKARKAAEASEVAVERKEMVGQAHVRESIEALLRAGRVSRQDASRLKEELKNPEHLLDVWNKVNAIRKGASLDRLENSKELDRLDDEHNRKVKEFNRDNLDAQGKYAFDLEEQSRIKTEMWQLDMDSNKYKTLRNELDDANHDVLVDQKNLERQKLEFQKAQAEEEKKKMREAIDKAQIGSAYPTLEDLAGRGRTDRLNELYGRGGRFDLGAGNGPFADIAYDAELAQKQQAWDRIHGNFNQAELDRRRYNLDISQIPVGALSPQEALGRIGENTGQLRELFDRLVTQGAIINTNIAGVSG